MDWQKPDWKVAITRIAESVREIGILLFVFVPLEVELKGSRGGHGIFVALAFASVGILFVVVGTVIESKL